MAFSVCACVCTHIHVGEFFRHLHAYLFNFPFYKDTSRLVVANDLILADSFLHATTLGLRDYSVSLEDALYLTTDGHLPGTHRKHATEH